MLIKSFLLTFSCSIIFTFLFVPFFAKFECIKKFLLNFSVNEFIGIFALIIFVILSSWGYIRNAWSKYKNNYLRLRRPPVVYLDYIFLFSILSILLILNFQARLLFKLPDQVLQALSIYMVIGLGWFFISYYLPKRGKVRESFQRLLLSRTDEPIQYDEQDLLDRHKFVENLYKEISEFSMRDSFVFGLYGNWGEGKTSVLNLLAKRFEDNKKFMVISFDPWHFKDSDAITAAFYKELECMFSRNYILPKLKSSFMQLQDTISCGLSKCGVNLNFLGLNLEFLSKNCDGVDNYDKIKGRIEQYIGWTQQKIVVIIDDIDRLQKEQILLIFKLVCSNTRFKDTIFILSLDHKATIKSIDSETGGMGKEYIAKIIQQPILLPKIEQSFLYRFLWLSDHHIPEYLIPELLNSKLDKISISTCGIVCKIGNNFLEVNYENDAKQSITVEIPRSKEALFKQQNFKLGNNIYIEGLYSDKKILINDIDSEIKLFRLSWIDLLFFDLLMNRKVTTKDVKDFDSKFPHLYQSQLYKLVKTLRDAKRYINSLYSSLPAIVEEINLEDFCLLEFIKVFQGDIYDDIFDNWWFYVEERMDGDLLFNPFTFSLIGKENEKNRIILEHINSVLQVVKNPTERDVMKELLKELFPRVEEAFRNER